MQVLINPAKGAFCFFLKESNQPTKKHVGAETYPTSSMMQPDQRSSHLHSPDRATQMLPLEIFLFEALRWTKKTSRFRRGTIKNSLLVRKYADVLAQRLSEGDGHLVCLSILAKRHREGGVKDRKVQRNRDISRENHMHNI